MHSAQRIMPFAALAAPFAAALLALAAPARATDEFSVEPKAIDKLAVSPSPFSASVTLASQYVARGIRQSWGRRAVQASLDYANPNGWSAGAWASTIDNRFVEGGTLELDLYAGYSGAAGPLGYNALITYYKYPGARIAATDTAFDYGELQAGLSWKSLYAKYNYTFTRDFFGITDARGTGYLDVGANHEFGPALTLNLHAGDGHVAGRGNGMWDWRDLRAGLSKRLEGGWVAAVNYTRALGATNVYDRYSTGIPRNDGRPAVSNVARRAIVLSLTRTF
jgi:uncharacterized protein (TIGR02001 family)